MNREKWRLFPKSEGVTPYILLTKRLNEKTINNRKKKHVLALRWDTRSHEYIHSETILLCIREAAAAVRSGKSRLKVDKASDIMSSLSKAVQHDIERNEQHRDKYEGVISSVSRNVNDVYLKANNQTGGLNSYSDMVNLLLAEQRGTEKYN